MLIGGLTKLEMNIGKMTIKCILAQRISKIVKVLLLCMVNGMIQNKHTNNLVATFPIAKKADK